MIQHQVTEKIANVAAVVSPIVAVGVTLADIVQYAQIAAYIGSAIGGIGAGIYYLTHRKKK